MKLNKGFGQYDLEYKNCPCFWGEMPAKFVRLIPKYIGGGTVLDLGAGEGKNSLFLNKLGYKVTSVEVSEYALINYLNWIKREQLVSPPVVILADVNKLDIHEKYDVVIAYGLLHCFNNLDQIDNLVKKMKAITNPGGINVIATFTNVLSDIPDVQNYLEPTLIDPDYLRNTHYVDWEVLEYENDILEEMHPTSQKLHQHSICRMIARK